MQETSCREVHLSQLFLLGCETFLGAQGLGALRVTSSSFSEEILPHQIEALIAEVARGLSLAHDDNVELKCIMQPALDSLVRVTAIGDSRTIGSCVACLASPDQGARKMGMNALAQSVKHGDSKAISAVSAILPYPHGEDDSVDRSQYFERADADVCRTALFALGQLSDKGDHVAFSRAIFYLEHSALDVRMTCVDVLRRVAMKGNLRAIQAVARSLWHNDQDIRVAAQMALRILVDTNVPETLGAIVAVLRSSSVDVRLAAIGAFEQIQHRGLSVVTSALTACLEDINERVRAAAAVALGNLANHGEPLARAALVPCLRDPEAIVRKSAVMALERLSRSDDRTIVGDIAPCLKDVDPSVCQAAALTLGRRMDNSNKNARIVSKILVLANRSSNADVRVAAAAALGQLIQRGNNVAILLVLRTVEQRKGHIDSLSDALKRRPAEMMWVVSAQWSLHHNRLDTRSIRPGQNLALPPTKCQIDRARLARTDHVVRAC